LTRLRVRVVLVRPETPANIGAVARIVRNTGLLGLDLVNPGDWRTVDCWRTAWGAHDLLEAARVFDELAPALSESACVIAFTGKSDREAPIEDVKEAVARVAEAGREQDAALVFGPESTGLTREEMALCGRRARIPSHPDQPSLNLSHAVMVAAYEVFRASLGSIATSRLATHEEKERFLALLREGLVAVGALSATNGDGYFLEWRNLFARADLSPKEIRLLEHMAYKMKARSS